MHTLFKSTIDLVYNFLVFLFKIYFSPGAKTLILSGFVTLSTNTSGLPLKGEKSGASTHHQ